jgi:hypothetical protein
MTIQEIQALRDELSNAMQQSFTEFHAATGLHVEGVDVEFIKSWDIGKKKPDKQIISVFIKLESI